MSAGALVAMGGLRRPSSSEVPANVYADLKSHLTQGLTNLIVTASDVKAVHTLLGTLPPAAYRTALERMQCDHLLGTYVEKQDPGARQAFLEQAESKGLLQRRPGEPPSGPCGMPGRPDLFVNDEKLPAAMRDAVNANAIDAGRAYFKAYDAYLGRYSEAMSKVRSFPELRRLGDFQKPQLNERALGLAWKDPRRKQYEADWKAGVGRPPSPTRALNAIEDKRKELLSKPTGRYALDFEAELTQGNLKLGGEARLDTKGGAEAKTKVGLSVEAGPYGAEVMRDSKGETKAKYKLELGVAEVQVDSEGEVELALKAGRFLKAYSVINPEQAEFGGGLIAGAHDEETHDKAELKLGLRMRGLSAETARRAVDLSSPSLFDPPHELGQGIAWDALPAERRALFAQQLGWTREEWIAAGSR